MAEPRVLILRYNLKPSAGVSFSDPPPLDHETDDFTMHIEKGLATFRMKALDDTSEHARECAEQWLRNWTMDDALRRKERGFEFEFHSCEEISPERESEPRSGRTIYVQSTVVATAMAKATATVIHSAYPSPPQAFVATPDVQSMWHRYEGYCNDREPLASMGFFCLTFFEWRAKQVNPYYRRSKIELCDDGFKVDKEVLIELGRLTSTGGDLRTARKVKTQSREELLPFSHAERTWIEATVLALIRRLGEYEANSATLTELTMEQLPPL